MLFVALFEDNPAAGGDVRQKHMAQHLTFLEKNAGYIRAAGPLRDGDAPAGGLWVVEASDAAQVRRLVEEDPFWPTGLRKSVRVLEWSQVFADGRRLI
jgi:uncharacterized protein